METQENKSLAEYVFADIKFPHELVQRNRFM
jgi:hypothetical protein